MVTRIGWIQDKIDYIGGAELSSTALRNATPEGFEIVRLSPLKRPPQDLDAYVIQNCVYYTQRWIAELERKPVIKQIRDPWFAGDSVLRRWILDNAKVITFNSPVHLAKFWYDVQVPTKIIPPPLDLAPFRLAAQLNYKRQNWITVGAVGPTKGMHIAIDKALQQDVQLDIYGAGDPRMFGKLPANIRFHGWVDYERIPQVMGRAQRFVFYPQWVESFGRVVAEAWAAGCELDIGGDVGALWWIKEAPAAIETGAVTFWELVREVVQ